MDKLIDKLKGGRPDHIEEVVSMQKTLKTAMLKKNLKEHPALQRLLAALRKRESSWTTILANKKDLTEGDRREYFAKREEDRFLISFFNVDTTIESIEKNIDYQLSDEIDMDGGDNA